MQAVRRRLASGDLATQKWCRLCVMGFKVNVVAVLHSSPSVHALELLSDHFGEVEHAPGSKTVTLIEHVSVSDEGDAVALVRSLATEALPDGAKITLTVIPDAPAE